MNLARKILSRIALCLACAATAAAQTAPKHPMDKDFTKPAPRAQKLVDETLAKHPEVVVMMMHVQPPRQKLNVVIASNIGRIGEIADEDDTRCIVTGKSNLEVNTAGNHFEDELPMKEKSGRIIGAMGLVFNYKQGDDKAKLIAIAEQIRTELQAEIPDKESLFAASE